MRLFQSNVPVLLSERPKSGNFSGVIQITRPSKFSNPFKIGYPISRNDIIHCAANLATPNEEINDAYLLRHFRVCLGLVNRGGTLNRSDAISAFREHWGHLRYTGTINDAEIEDLAGKKLLCCCGEKACHGSVIIEDFRRLKFKASVLA